MFGCVALKGARIIVPLYYLRVEQSCTLYFIFPCNNFASICKNRAVCFILSIHFLCLPPPPPPPRISDPLFIFLSFFPIASYSSCSLSYPFHFFLISSLYFSLSFLTPLFHSSLSLISLRPVSLPLKPPSIQRLLALFNSLDNSPIQSKPSPHTQQTN